MLRTPLRRMGFFTRLFSLFLAMLTGLVGFLFPPLWILTLLLVTIAISYRTSGHCPACGNYLEVTKKNGGVKCPGCGTPLRVDHGKTLTAIL